MCTLAALLPASRVSRCPGQLTPRPSPPPVYCALINTRLQVSAAVAMGVCLSARRQPVFYSAKPPRTALSAGGSCRL